MIHEEICTYEVCKLAKERGFNWGCLYHYDCKGSLHQHYAYDDMNSGVGVDDLLMYDDHLYTSECLASTQSLLQRWLREEKFIDISIYPIFINGVRVYTAHMYTPNLNKPKKFNYFDTYELVLENVLKEALENFV